MLLPGVLLGDIDRTRSAAAAGTELSVKVRWLDRLVTTRRLLRALETIAGAQQIQTILLTRLVDRLAPAIEPEAKEQEVRQVSGTSYGRDEEFARIESFIEKCQHDLQRIPSEQEVIDFLDGKEVSI